MNPDSKPALGLYRVYWKSGGSSLAAVGQLPDGSRWLAPANWVRPTEDPRWQDIETIERLDPDRSIVKGYVVRVKYVDGSVEVFEDVAQVVKLPGYVSIEVNQFGLAPDEVASTIIPFDQIRRLDEMTPGRSEEG